MTQVHETVRSETGRQPHNDNLYTLREGAYSKTGPSRPRRPASLQPCELSPHKRALLQASCYCCRSLPCTLHVVNFCKKA